MGRIIVQARITNLFEEDKSIRCGMLVDTGAGALILPTAWKERLGKFKRSEAVELQLANQEVLRGEACWPVEIRIDGFRPVSNEVVFVDMGSEDEGEYKPLLGYVILEQAQAAVDMLGHRLVPVKYIDMKSIRRGDFAAERHVPSRHDTFPAGGLIVEMELERGVQAAPLQRTEMATPPCGTAWRSGRRGYGAVSLSTISSIASSAMARISSSVRFWIGCGTQTIAGS